MIKNFETYIVEGRLGRIMGATQNDESRKEDIGSRFFGNDKEWMLYKDDGHYVFYPKSIDEALEKYGENGWRIATINDFFQAFGYNDENMPEALHPLTKTIYVLNPFKNQTFTQIPVNDDTLIVRSKYGEMTVPAKGYIPHISNDNQVRAIGIEFHFYVFDEKGEIHSGYINEKGILAIITDGNCDSAASIILIKDKKK